MKLIYIINVFEGTEFLSTAINELKDLVDGFLISYQTKNYFGNSISSEDLSNIYALRDQFDNLKILFHLFQIKEFAENSEEAKILETRKRNEALKFVNDLNYFTHFIMTDSDELYKKEEFQKAKEFIIQNNIEYSSCNYINYSKRPTYQALNTSKNVVPFICKLKYTELGVSSELGIGDPTRMPKLNKYNKYTIFLKDELLMHHFSNVRKDLYKKYHSSSISNLDKTKINLLIDQINYLQDDRLLIPYDDFKILDKIYTKVENYFNINL